jgi:hypothetical protein
MSTEDNRRSSRRRSRRSMSEIPRTSKFNNIINPLPTIPENSELKSETTYNLPHPVAKVGYTILEDDTEKKSCCSISDGLKKKSKRRPKKYKRRSKKSKRKTTERKSKRKY